MRFEKFEKGINKIDHDIDALRTCKQYLKGSTSEIEDHIVELNKERQGLIDALCREDLSSYEEFREIAEPLLGKNLNKEEQLVLLQQVKECFGRKAPVVGKNSHGLNAWCKALCIAVEWEEIPGQEWAILRILHFGTYKQQDF